MARWSTTEEERKHVHRIAESANVLGTAILKSGMRLSGFVAVTTIDSDDENRRSRGDIAVGNQIVDNLDVAEIGPPQSN